MQVVQRRGSECVALVERVVAPAARGGYPKSNQVWSCNLYSCWSKDLQKQATTVKLESPAF
ncbi:hypothetical protein NIES4106_09310 [Fischerella sp. NIES-4106]|jgi:hypothetical protein|nr:hypothetical protein NIES4106_09310 [Fischerella sp. NIES-4106]